MIYLTPNQSKEVVVTANDNLILFTATYSVSNADDMLIDLPKFKAYGKVGESHQFNTVDAYIEMGGEVGNNSLASVTETSPGIWILECLGETAGYPQLYIWYYRETSYWPLQIIIEGFAPPPTIVTYVKPASFVWSIQDQDTFLNYTFSNKDISDNTGYYNAFSFSVIPGATYGLTAGIIPAPQGNYIYNVYQTEYNGSLIPIGNSLEVGLLEITATWSNPTISIIGDDNTIIVDKNIN